MKIYVVTRGDYSDYHIVGATLDKKKAQHIAKLYSDDWYTATVEEYDEDAFSGNEQPAWRVNFDEDGTRDIEKIIYPPLNMPQVVDYTDKKESFVKYVVCVFADDKEHAFKVAQDALAKYKAEKEEI